VGRRGVWAFSSGDDFHVDSNFIGVHGQTSCVCVILLDNILRFLFTLIIDRDLVQLFLYKIRLHRSKSFPETRYFQNTQDP
jgi:hypothetical protein